MIKYVSGDILLSNTEAIVHGIAPGDDFKQGLALQLRERWPSMYKDFRHYCKTKSPKSGELWSWKAAGSPLIINLMTQNPPKSAKDHPGKAEIQHVNHCLKELKKELVKQEVKSFAITRLATGVGGLPWSEVRPMIDSQLGELDQTVEVYEEYHKDQKAEEI